MNSKQYKGFTLLEVLVALVIIAIALSTTMKTTGDITNSSFHLRQKVFANWIAQNRLAELKLSDKWPGKGVKKDTVEFADQEWEWEQKTSETPHKDIHKVEISVKNTEADDDSDPIIVLVSYSLNPQLLIQGEVSFSNTVTPNNNRRNDDRNTDSDQRRDRRINNDEHREREDDLRDRDEYDERNEYDDELQ